MRRYLILVLSVIVLVLGIINSKETSSRQTFQKAQKEKSINSPQASMTPAVSGVPDRLSSQRQKALVTRVIDGDTIEIQGGVRVRYIGIDTPETVDPRKPVQCFGEEAAEKNRELVLGKEIELEKDISETDKYGRLLRYVYIDNLFINDFLVRQGFARASSYPPDVKYQDQLRQAGEEAKENNKGLWSTCSEVKAEMTGECQIKGNISSTGEKIYHLPDCPYWSKTVISEEKGERWFCSEEEAQAAGWRKAQNCP